MMNDAAAVSFARTRITRDVGIIWNWNRVDEDARCLTMATSIARGCAISMFSLAQRPFAGHFQATGEKFDSKNLHPKTLQLIRSKYAADFRFLGLFHRCPALRAVEFYRA